MIRTMLFPKEAHLSERVQGLAWLRVCGGQPPNQRRRCRRQQEWQGLCIHVNDRLW